MEPKISYLVMSTKAFCWGTGSCTISTSSAKIILLSCGKNDKTKFSHNHTDYDVDTVNSGDRSDDDFIESQLLDYNYCNSNDYDSQGQQSTAVSKVQIKLSNLINNHKRLLKLYHDIVDLFNDYVPSPNFDKYAQLKSKKSFIHSMERMTMQLISGQSILILFYTMVQR